MMNKLNLIVVGILCLIGAALPVQSAELTGKDFPYWIFNDEGVTTYCMEPDRIGQIYTPCWANGIKTDCIILHEEDGYIDCKKNEVLPPE